MRKRIYTDEERKEKIRIKNALWHKKNYVPHPRIYTKKVTDEHTKARRKRNDEKYKATEKSKTLRREYNIKRWANLKFREYAKRYANEYNKRPERKNINSEYQAKRYAKNYGEFSEAFLQLRSIEKELKQRSKPCQN